MFKKNWRLMAGGAIMMGLGNMSAVVFSECGPMFHAVFCLMSGCVYVVIVSSHIK